MTKMTLGKTGLEISRVLYGGIVSMDDGQDNSDKYVEYAVKNGINYFDVAPTYGDAQEKLGNSLKAYRKDIYLACKTTERKLDPAMREFETSLKLLHTDYFDVYQLHALQNVPDLEEAFKNDGLFSRLIKLKEEGVIKNLGVTCHSEQAALRAFELYDFDTVLFPTNWALDMEKGFGSRISQLKKEKNFGYLGMKSMIHRAWADDKEKENSRFPKSWCMPITDNKEFTIAAIKYAFEMGIDSMVPPGNIENFTFAVEHADEIVKPLTDSERQLLQSELPKIGDKFFF